MQLPENFSPIGVGTNRSSHIRLSAKFALIEYSEIRVRQDSNSLLYEP
jgi:hypothetical protein